MCAGQGPGGRVTAAYAPPPPVSAEDPRDAEHLRMLRTCHFVWAALAGIGGLVLGAFMIGFSFFFRTALRDAAARTPPGGGAPPVEFIDSMSWIHTAMGGAYLVGGVVMASLALVTARCLRVRRGRTFCLVASAVQCLAMPVGTTLGVFTMLVLTRPSVGARFERPRS